MIVIKNRHFKVTLFYVIMSCGADLLIEIFVVIDMYIRFGFLRFNSLIVATYFVSHCILWIVLSQHLLMMFAVKTRFAALNVIFR